MKCSRKKLGLILGFLASLLICGSVFAATTPETGDLTELTTNISGVDLFTPSVNDKSISYLGQLFGSVGDVLHGTSGQLFAKMFEVLNVGVLVVAILFFSFNMTKWFVEAGAQGQFMNQKGGGLFMFIRSIIGIGILVPKAAGYSIIQIIVMWMVVQGIGLADKTWSTALDYLNSESGTVYNSPAVITEPLLTRTTDVLVAEVCMIKSHKILQAQADQMMQAENGGVMPNGIQGRLTTTTHSIPAFQAQYNATNGTFYFPGSADFNKNNPPSNDAGLCGAFKIGDVELDAKGEPIPTTLLTTKKAAFEALYNALLPEAEQIANWPDIKKQIEDNASSDTRDADIKEAETNQQKQVVSDLYGAASDYLNGVSSLNLGAGNLGKLNEMTETQRQAYFDNAKEEGWIMAGRYYHMLGLATSNAKADFLKELLPTVVGSRWITVEGAAPDLTQITSKEQRDLFPDESDAKELLSAIEKAQKYGLVANELRAQRNALHDTTAIGQDFRDQGARLIRNDPLVYTLSVLNPVAGPTIAIELSQLKVKVAQMMEGQNNSDPILGLKNLGEELLTFVSIVWLAGSLTAFVMGIAGAICAAANPVTYALTLAYKWLIPLLMAILGVFLAIGMVLYAYVPLIPFILFTFAAIGWFFSVIEAMVAGPLVAFGMTHPEGHDFLGKAEQAGMLLLSVFLKPTLMLMGLLGGMMLSRIALQLLNHGFVYLLQDLDILQTGGVQFGGFLKLGAVIVVYAFLALAIVKQAFSMIYIIPEKVMRWIGLSPDYTQMPKEVMEGGQGMTSSFGSQAGGMGGKMTESGKESGEEVVKGIKKIKEKFGNKTGYQG